MTSIEKPLICRTKTGKKLHKAYAGSSVTHCGHWLKVSAIHYQVEKAFVVKALEKGQNIPNYSGLGPKDLILCEHCFPVDAARTAAYVEETTEQWVKPAKVAA